MNPVRHGGSAEEASAAVAFISVVMPVRNEALFIADTLRALVSQDYPSDRMEILVVDGQSDDGTQDIVRRFASNYNCVRLLHNPKRWSSAARNIGVRNSTGEVITIIDGHCDIPGNQYLIDLARAFSESGADIVGRPQSLSVKNATPIQQAIAIARASRLGHHPDSFIYSSQSQFVPAASVGTAYRREVFERIGFFDEAFDACEDVDFNTRADFAGEKCYFTKDVEIRYYPRASLLGLFGQMTRYGRGRVRLARKQPTTASFKSFLPGLFVAGLIVGPLAAAFHSVLAFTFMAVVVTYVLIVAVTSGWLAICNRKLGLWWRLQLVFATVHVGAGWGILKEFVVGRTRPPQSSDA